MSFGLHAAIEMGFVNVCGICLPKRDRAARQGDAASAPSVRLVATPSSEKNLEAAALVLCQERPLLLEGPPGILSCTFWIAQLRHTF